jgi:thioredoxin 2
MIRRCPKCQTKNRIPAARLDQSARCGACGHAVAPLDAPHEVATDAELGELLTGSPLPVLVDFWATWCGPCRILAPELAKLAKEHAGRIVVVKVDTDALPQVASRHGIKGVPTMLLFRGGQVVRQITGAQPARSISTQLGL